MYNVHREFLNCFVYTLSDEIHHHLNSNSDIFTIKWKNYRVCTYSNRNFKGNVICAGVNYDAEFSKSDYASDESYGDINVCDVFLFPAVYFSLRSK